MSGLSGRRGVFTPSMLDATKELGIQKRDISEARSSCGLQHMIPIELQKRTAYVQCSRTFRYLRRCWPLHRSALCDLMILYTVTVVENSPAMLGVPGDALPLDPGTPRKLIR
jgi:hypothetical protein